MNELALFAGYGGNSLALKLAGEILGFTHRTGCYVEREAYAASLLVSKGKGGKLDNAPVWDDVATFDGTPWHKKVDIITAGFPCQPWSYAGKQQKTKDRRWLWDDIARSIRQVRPRYVFLENTPGILDGGIEHILATLASHGYNAEWDMFSADSFGASQKRERWFLLAESKSIRSRRWGNGNTEGEYRALQTKGSSSELADTTSSKSNRLSSILREENRKAWDASGELDNPTSSGCQTTSIPSRHETPLPKSFSASRPFPPRPGDEAGWRAVLNERPALEPAVRRVADGVTNWVDRLRAIGNGVVPVVAAYAFVTLAKRLEE